MSMKFRGDRYKKRFIVQLILLFFINGVLVVPLFPSMIPTSDVVTVDEDEEKTEHIEQEYDVEDENVNIHTLSSSLCVDDYVSSYFAYKQRICILDVTIKIPLPPPNYISDYTSLIIVRAI